MRKLLWAIPALLLVSVIFTYIYIQTTPSNSSTTQTIRISPSPQPKPNLLTQDHEFINSKHKYKLLYSDIYQINTPNAEISDQVNFRSKSDEIPTQSGISMWVIDSKVGLRDTCKTVDLENYGILCPREKITFNPLLDSIPWEVYPRDLIGVVPSGYVYASTYAQGKIYIIVNYGYEEIVAGVFTSNFSFTK